jgi:fluoroquinolone transport system permease protein
MGAAPVSVATARFRQLVPLSGPLREAMRWQPLAGAVVLSAGLLAWKAGDLDDSGTALMALRGVAALLALGAAFLLDDAAADTLACSPTSLAWRRSSYLLAAAALTGVPWAAALGTAQSLGADLPLAALTLEFCALLALALAAAAGLARWADTREPGVVAVPLTVGLILAVFRLPESWALLVGPGPGWAAAHQRWALLLALALLVIAAALRDLARA